jgi:two-component system, chemotaxis family, sensor kinase Cph1
MRELNRQLTKIVQDKDLLLQQNEFLIGEVNHRVQNSLQLVSSYLALQARTSTNPELLVALEEARRRISAVSLVHRRLYRGDQLALVDAARYIEELCADTFAFMGQDWAQHFL